MRKSIFRYFIIVLTVTLLSSCFISATLISNSLLETTKHDMLYSLNLIVYALNDEDPLQDQILALNPLAYSDETRITIVDFEGEVLADTEGEDSYENHIDRSEIQDAMKDGVGYATRKSETTDFDTLYVAYLSDEYIVRLSIPYNGIIEYIPSLIPAFTVSAVVSFIIAMLLSRRLSYRISAPIVEISDSLEKMSDDFRFSLKEYEYTEFNNIVNTIHNLSHRLRKSLREIKLEKYKIDEILRQMNEGFILLDENYKILIINSKADALLGNLKVDDNLIERIHYPEILNALNTNTYKQVIELKIGDSIYACYISKIDLGTTLLFLDITASKKSEKMRREFFSNVSHELKTPITSIKGYSELLANGYVQDEEKKIMMLNKILGEVDNISSLINDILLLSRIENMDIEVEMVPMRIKSVVNEVLESYAVEVSNHHLNIHCEFHDMIYTGNPSQMHTLFNNLIGNAIKYNKEGGEVFINVVEEENAMKIVVRDTGIGIPLADQSRIFERFYMVDKARSKQRGGTGLGLAIVKHIVTNYKGTIHLDSVLNKGTTIEIVLPQQTATKEV